MTQAGCVQEQGSPFHAECGSGEGWLGGQSSRGHAIIYSTAGCATLDTPDLIVWVTP